MKSRTKKRIAAVATGISALAGVAYALSGAASQPEREASGPMFRSDTPFFTEGMDLAVSVPTKSKMTGLPATKRMYETRRFESQYKPKGGVIRYSHLTTKGAYVKAHTVPVVATRARVPERQSTKSVSLGLADDWTKRLTRAGYKTKRNFFAIK